LGHDGREKEKNVGRVLRSFYTFGPEFEGFGAEMMPT
jgi:hypothetical protein